MAKSKVLHEIIEEIRQEEKRRVTGATGTTGATGSTGGRNMTAQGKTC